MMEVRWQPPWWELQLPTMLVLLLVRILVPMLMLMLMLMLVLRRAMMVSSWPIWLAKGRHLWMLQMKLCRFAASVDPEDAEFGGKAHLQLFFWCLPRLLQRQSPRLLHLLPLRGSCQTLLSSA